MSSDFIETVHSARFIGIANRKDTAEDLEDFPPIPSTMVLPEGTTLFFTVRYLKPKNLKSVNKTRRARDHKGEKQTPEEEMEEVAEKVDILFKIYDIFLGAGELNIAFTRAATWLKIKQSKGDIAAMKYEAQCKRDDAIRDEKEYWLSTIAASMEQAREAHAHSTIDIEIGTVVGYVLEDIDSFLESTTWKESVLTYCQDPFATGWFRDENSALIDMFKHFLLKKYKSALLQRYRTLLSPSGDKSISSPAIETLRISVEESLKRFLAAILAGEEQYAKDLRSIEKMRDLEEKKPFGFHTLARKIGHIIFGQTHLSENEEQENELHGIEGFPKRHTIS